MQYCAICNQAMYSDAPRCDICGVAFTGEDELERHRLNVHSEGKLQCQACGRLFDGIEEFRGHLKMVHAGDPQLDLGKEQTFDDMQSELLRKSGEEEKARKRSRGPYRKSAAA